MNRIQSTLASLQQSARFPDVEADQTSDNSEDTLENVLEPETSDQFSQDLIRTGPFIFNVHGITGLGKTRFIYHLMDTLAALYPTILLSFAQDEDRHPKFTHTWGDVLPDLRKYLPGLEQLPDEIILTRGGLQPLDEKCLIYEQSQLDQPRTQPVLLLLDGLDNLLYWKWVQEEIVKPLYDQHHAVVVCTSQSPIFWHFWELRESCELLSLAPFDLKETQHFLAYSQRDFIAQSFYNITRGYPLGLKSLTTALELGILTDAAQETALPAPQPGMLSDVTKLVLAYTGMIRYADVSIMLGLLDHFAADWTTRPKATLRMTVLPELENGGYFKPYHSSQAMQFVVSVRNQIDSHTFQTDPDRYRKTCQYLEHAYAQRVVNKPLTETHSFNEWLFFSTTLIDLGVMSMSVWIEQLGIIIERVKLVGNKAGVLFVKDAELLNKLRAGNYLRVVEQMLRTTIVDDGREPLLSGTEYEHYQRYVLDQLNQYIPEIKPPRGIKLGISELLHLIREIGDEFDANSLRKKIRDKEGLEAKAGWVNNTIAILYSLGLVKYNRTQHMYRLNDLLDPFLIN